MILNQLAYCKISWQAAPQTASVYNETSPLDTPVTRIAQWSACCKSIDTLVCESRVLEELRASLSLSVG